MELVNRSVRVDDNSSGSDNVGMGWDGGGREGRGVWDCFDHSHQKWQPVGIIPQWSGGVHQFGWTNI